MATTKKTTYRATGYYGQVAATTTTYRNGKAVGKNTTYMARSSVPKGANVGGGG